MNFIKEYLPTVGKNVGMSQEVYEAAHELMTASTPHLSASPPSVAHVVDKA